MSYGIGIGHGFAFWRPSGAVADPFLPTSYAGLLSWQTAEDNVTTTDVVANTDLATWTPTNQSAPVGSKADPVGGTSAWEITETVAAAAKSLSAAFVGTRQSGELEFDVYVKRGTVGTPAAPRHVVIGRTTGEAIYVNLDTGAFSVGSPTPHAKCSVTAVAGGWWRIRGVLTHTALANCIFYISASATSVSTTAGDGTSSLFVYSPYFVRQRFVDSLPVKAGTANVASTQGTAANKPILLESVSLGGRRIIGSLNAANTTKSLTDDPAIATALSGTDKAFTVTWLGRNTANVACDWLRLVGATASHDVLQTNAAGELRMDRTDDSGTLVNVTPTTQDFDADRNWHAFSVVFSGTTAELWIDGQKSVTTHALDVGAATFTSVVSQFVSCYWRERTIYSRALNTTERAALELGMISRAGLPVPSLENPLNIPGVQGYWETDQGVTLASASVNSDATTWTVGTGVTLADNGNSTYRLTDTDASGGGAHYVTLGSGLITGAAAGTVIETFELKRVGTRDWVFVANASGAVGAYFNLANGTVGTLVGGATATIEDLGAGWYRCSTVWTYASGGLRLYAAEADNDVSYVAGGAAGAQFDVRNASLTQNRVSSWLSKDLGRIAMTQATAGSQPFYFSGSYVTGSQINSLPTIGEDLNAATETMSIAAPFAGAWSGSDVPASAVALVNRTGNPSTTTSPLLLAGAGTARQAFLRHTTGGFGPTRTDDAGTVLIPAVYGAPAQGVQTVSEVFTGTSVSLWANGVQLGVAKALDVGTCTFDGTLAMNHRANSFRGFIIANRELTTAERTALENGFKRRAGLL